MHVTGDNIYIWLFLVYLLCGHRRESVVWQYEHVTYVNMVYLYRATDSCAVLYACDRRQYVHTTVWKYISCVDIDVSLWRGSMSTWHMSKWLPVHLYRATGDNVYIWQKDYRVYWKRWVHEHMTCVNMLACSPVPRDGQLCSIICTWQVTLYTGNTLKSICPVWR